MRTCRVLGAGVRRRFGRCGIITLMMSLPVAGLGGCGPRGPEAASGLAAASGAGAVGESREAVPARVLSESESGIVVRFAAPRADEAAVTLEGRGYTALDLPGFDPARRPGWPSLPTLTVHLIVPRDARVGAPVIEEAVVESGTLAADAAFVDRAATHGPGDAALVARSAEAYQMVHGDQAVVVADVSFAGPLKLATIVFHPLRYDAPQRGLMQRREVTVRFPLLRGGAELDAAQPVADRAPSAAPFVALNGERHREGRGMRDDRVDLVIAHESHRAALARYLAFKRENGRTVREHYVQGRTSAQIKEIIRAEYASAAPPAHVLLIGNIDQIPSWRGSGDNSWTDADYQNLDAGTVPDLSMGRVPAHDAAELGAWIDKAIAREVEPRNDDDVLLTAGRDVSLGCPASVTRMGERMRPASASVRIIKRFRSEGATTDQVIEAYNAAPNVVVYDGHGDQQGMQEIPLVISNLSRLTNGQYPIVFDIACLNANWGGGARSRNFAEKILLQRQAGVAGILASGGSGYGHDFFQSMGGLMADARQGLGRGETLLNEVGQVVLAAKIRHGAQDRTYWNYYGDPATTVWSGVGR